MLNFVILTPAKKLQNFFGVFLQFHFGVDINPAADCKLPAQTVNEMQVLTREEMQRFLIQAREEGYYELFLLELATGLRRGEVLALRWDDLNFDTGELRIERQVYRVNGELAVSAPKTKASLRTIVLPPSLVEVLREYRQQVHSRWMFPSPTKEDSPLDPAACRKRLQTILKHAGCKRVRFHDLRHLFVTTALESGMDVKTLSTIIGHVSAKTTLNIYTHVTDAMQETAAAKSTGESENVRPIKPARHRARVYPPEWLTRAAGPFLSRTRANSASQARDA